VSGDRPSACCAARVARDVPRGLICRSTTEATRGPVAPPLISTREDIDFMVAQCARSSPEPSSSPGSAPTSIALWSSPGTHPVVARPALDAISTSTSHCWRRLYRHVTARERSGATPSLRICVWKGGAGRASGRNGGWASALFPSSDSSVIRRYGRDAFTHQTSATTHSVGELGDAAEADGIRPLQARRYLDIRPKRDSGHACAST